MAGWPCCSHSEPTREANFYIEYPLTKGLHCQNKFRTPYSVHALLPAILCFIDNMDTDRKTQSLLLGQS